MELGSEVPASAIHWHMQSLRKKATAMGIITPKRTSQARAKRPVVAKARKTSGEKKETKDSDEDDDGEDRASIFSKTSMDKDSDEDSITKIEPDLSLNQQKTIAGRVKKIRTSPRKKQKPDYKALFDQLSAEEADTSEKGESSVDKELPSDMGTNVATVEENIKVKAEI